MKQCSARVVQPVAVAATLVNCPCIVPGEQIKRRASPTAAPPGRLQNARAGFGRETVRLADCGANTSTSTFYSNKHQADLQLYPILDVAQSAAHTATVRTTDPSAVGLSACPQIASPRLQVSRIRVHGDLLRRCIGQRFVIAFP